MLVLAAIAAVLFGAPQGLDADAIADNLVKEIIGANTRERYQYICGNDALGNILSLPNLPAVIKIKKAIVDNIRDEEPLGVSMDNALKLADGLPLETQAVLAQRGEFATVGRQMDYELRPNRPLLLDLLSDEVYLIAVRAMIKCYTKKHGRGRYWICDEKSIAHVLTSFCSRGGSQQELEEILLDLWKNGKLSFLAVAQIAFKNNLIGVFHALNDEIDEEEPWTHDNFPLYFFFYSQYLQLTIDKTRTYLQP